MVNNFAALNETKLVETEDGQTMIPRRCQTSNSTMSLISGRQIFLSAELPPVVHPKGLSEEGQWYLFEKIRPFYSLRSKDLTCPT